MRSNSEDSKLDYRLLLMKEFQHRRQRNGAYSLTAFARTLEVSAAYLSQVFAGKRILSETKALSFSKRLRWNETQKKLFLTLVRYRRASNEDGREQALSELDGALQLDCLELEVDQFELVSEWYHNAIVELTGLKEFKAEPRWIASRLSITRTQAEEALSRLLRTGLLQNENGQLQKAKPFHRKGEVPSAAGRSFFQTHLGIASEALQNQEFDQRDFSGITVAIDKKKLPELKQLLRDFRQKFNKICSDHKDANAVYHLATQFYRIDNQQETTK